MRRTVGRLADGREILYFDRPGAPPRPTHDPRALAPVRTASHLRYDPLVDEWVVIATHRQDRTHLPRADECPLCPSRAGRQTEIPAPDYDVVVFENRFPSLAPGQSPAPLAAATALSPRRSGAGRCEVVCFTPDHTSSFSRLSAEHARLVVDAWADRTRALAAIDGVEQVFCFENRGEETGVTLHHPHGQIYAYPFVPPRTRRMLEVARRHGERTGQNLFADVLAAERASEERVVVKSDQWTAFVPAAARWPVEVHLYPHRQVAGIADLDDVERDDFVRTYLDVLRRFDRLYGTPMPYIAAWFQAPVHEDPALSYLHLQVFSMRRAPHKLKYLAGSESAMGAFVTDVLPEDTARRLRDVTR